MTCCMKRRYLAVTVKLFGWNFNVRTAKQFYTNRNAGHSANAPFVHTQLKQKTAAIWTSAPHEMQWRLTSECFGFFPVNLSRRIWKCIRFLIVASHWFVMASYSFSVRAREQTRASTVIVIVFVIRVDVHVERSPCILTQFVCVWHWNRFLLVVSSVSGFPFQLSWFLFTFLQIRFYIHSYAASSEQKHRGYSNQIIEKILLCDHVQGLDEISSGGESLTE